MLCLEVPCFASLSVPGTHIDFPENDTFYRPHTDVIWHCMSIKCVAEQFLTSQTTPILLKPTSAINSYD